MTKFSILLVLLLGFLFFSPVSAQSAQVTTYTSHNGLAGNFITAVAFEPNGSAWIGTSEGATHISNAGWVSYTQSHGLGNNFVTSIAVAPDGRIWFGTQSGGLSVLDPAAKAFTTYTLDNSEIPSNFVTALAVTTDNQLWVGTLDNGLARYDANADTWAAIEFPESEVTTIGLSWENVPWVGTAAGLYVPEGETWVKDSRFAADPIRRIDAFDGNWFVTMDKGDGGGAVALLEGVNDSAIQPTEITDALAAAHLSPFQVTAFGKDEQQRFWVGTSRGLFMATNGNAPTPPAPLPVVLIHGWTVAPQDTLETGEFRFIKSYADRDGIPMYYVRGVSPKNTLFQNAQVIRDEIARVKKETGASKVNIVAFSMGGMNTRAYLETSVYADDVNRAIILGTPQAGVEVWKPVLIQQILEKFDEPSAIELSPEYAEDVVKKTRAPNPNVPYDLLIGDARQQAGLGFLEDMPASDALISVDSALKLNAPNVNKHVNADLHDWGPEPVPIDLTGYLYPRETWERYLRNALRNSDNAPIGSEVSTPAPTPTELPTSNHTPVVTDNLMPTGTVTRTVTIDANSSARFVAYYPGGAIDFSLIAPDGSKYEPSDLPRDDGSGVLSLSTDIASFSGYVVKNALVGEWQIVLERTDTGREPLAVSTYAELTAEQQLYATVLDNHVRVGNSMPIVAGLATTLPETAMSARIAEPNERYGAPFRMTNLTLFDDGNHSDEQAGDGIFGASYVPPRAGWYIVSVQATSKGLMRERELLFTAYDGDATIAPTAEVHPNPASHTVVFDTKLNTPRAGRYAVAALLRDAETLETVATRFVPVSLNAGENTISVSFDTAHLERGGYALFLKLFDADWAAFEIASADKALAQYNH